MKNLYQSRRWRHETRLRIIARDRGICQKCGILTRQGRAGPRAGEVDHIVDHHGDSKLFFDHQNLQLLCKSCHIKKTVSATTKRLHRDDQWSILRAAKCRDAAVVSDDCGISETRKLK